MVHSVLDLCNNKLTVITGRMQQLVSSLGLVAPELVAAFVACRVLPLQARPHRMCDMSGRTGASRLSTVELSLHKVVARVNKITNFQLDEEEWSFYMEPYRHGKRASAVSPWVTGIVPFFVSC